MVFLGILIALVIFSIVVIVHEYGHFKAARKFWVKVEEFGLGLPPRAKILWTDAKGTIFSLNWLPLWGFVKIAGENPPHFHLYNKKWEKLSQEKIEKSIKKWKPLYDKDGEKISKKQTVLIQEQIHESQAPYNMANKPARQQSVIILAGVFMNFLLASIIFSILFMVGVKPVWINTIIPMESEVRLIPTLDQAIDEWIIEKHAGIYLYPVEWSVAESSGIHEWDLLLRINEQTPTDISEVQNIISQRAWTPVIFYVERVWNCVQTDASQENPCVEEFLEIDITPWADGKIWSYLSENLQINQDFEYKYWFFNAIKYGFAETYGQIKLTVKALGMLGKNIFFPEKPSDRSEAVNQLSGPIGIVDFISNSLSWGFVFLCIITAIISVNLWVFNLLPIPALDGWRFLFILINSLYSKITGKKAIDPQVESVIHVMFFMILIGLSVLVAYNDVVKIFNR